MSEIDDLVISTREQFEENHAKSKRSLQKNQYISYLIWLIIVIGAWDIPKAVYAMGIFATWCLFSISSQLEAHWYQRERVSILLDELLARKRRDDIQH